MPPLKNSITMDSNPEGHNQYSGGSGRANAAHSKAAQEWHRAGGPEGERQAQAHESAAHTHSMAASALRASK
jgi:hypothetical protein